MALPLTTDPGTAPPWLRPKALPGYSTMPMQTDPASDPLSPQVGGAFPSVSTPGAPNDYPYGTPPVQTDPATDPGVGHMGGNLGLPNYNTPTGSPVFGGGALSLAGMDSPSAAPAAPASGPNYNTPSGLPTGGGMPAWNAGMLASNGTSVPGSPGSVAPPSSFEAFLADLPGISTDFSADAKHASDDAYKGRRNTSTRTSRATIRRSRRSSRRRASLPVRKPSPTRWRSRSAARTRRARTRPFAAQQHRLQPGGRLVLPQRSRRPRRPVRRAQRQREPGAYGARAGQGRRASGHRRLGLDGERRDRGGRRQVRRPMSAAR
jgi:hypothetical protein